MSFYDERIRSREEPPWGRGKLALFCYARKKFREGQRFRLIKVEDGIEVPGRTFRIQKIYPFFFCCREEKTGFIECFHYLDVVNAERIGERPVQKTKRGGSYGL